MNSPPLLFRPLLAGLSLTILLAAGLPGAALGCSCLATSPEEAVAEADLIAEVEAGASVPVAPQIQAHAVDTAMLVVRRFRGDVAEGRELYLRAGTVSSECGVIFERGRRYLLFASRDGTLWRTNSCTRTGPIERAGAELELLEGAASPNEGPCHGKAIDQP